MFGSMKNSDNRLRLLASLVAISVALAFTIWLVNIVALWIRSFGWSNLNKVIVLALMICLIIVLAKSALRLPIECVYRSLEAVVFACGVQSVRARRLRKAWLMVRVQRYASRLYLFLHPCPMFRVSRFNPVWGGVYHFSFVRILRQIAASLISWSAIIAAMISAMLVYGVNLGALDPYSKLSALFNGEISLMGVIEKIFLSAPVIVASFALVPTLFASYFYGQKRDVRKIIDGRHRQKFVDVICLYDRLYQWIVDNAAPLVERLWQLIDGQRALVDDIVGKWPMYNEFYLKNPRLSDIVCGQALRIPVDVSELEQIFRLLSSKELRSYSRNFASSNFDAMRLLVNEILVHNQLRSLEERLFTKRGLELRFSEYIRLAQMGEADLDQSIADNFATDLYSSLLLVYELKMVWDWLGKYLYSSRAEKMVLMVFTQHKSSGGGD